MSKKRHTKHRPKLQSSVTYKMFENGTFNNAWPQNYNFLLGYTDNERPQKNEVPEYVYQFRKNGNRELFDSSYINVG